MKYSLLASALILPLSGCSPKQATPAGQAPTTLNPDLGKTPDYFRNLYGAPKSAKQVAEFAFPLPGHGSSIRLPGRFAVQDFEKDALKVQVVFSETPQRALWVKYTLQSPWTQEQTTAALQAYAQDWKVADENPAMSLFCSRGLL